MFFGEFLGLGSFSQFHSVCFTENHFGFNVEDCFAVTVAHMNMDRLMIVAVEKETVAVLLENDGFGEMVNG